MKDALFAWLVLFPIVFIMELTGFIIGGVILFFTMPTRVWNQILSVQKELP